MDGTGVKPYLASKRLNALAIGASGGCYTSSPKTFKATLDRFSDLPIVFTPDAGDIENPSVMRRILATYQLVQSFNREMEIVWWGQSTKSDHHDIDEIGEDAKIQTINWAEFVAIAITALDSKGEKTDFLVAPKLAEAPTKTSKKIPSKFESSIEKGLIIPGSEDKADIRVGNHLDAVANVNTPEGEGVVLQFVHRREFKTCTTILYREDLAGDGLATLRALARQGYDWSYHQKNSLLEALHQLGRGDIPDATITNKTGWHGTSYVTAHKTYGDRSIRFMDWEPSPDALTEIVGTIEGWRRDVGKKCEGNSRLVLALGAGFSAPMIRLLKIAESGGVHIYGDSSEGKTTSAKVLLSITGEKAVQTWNQTINGIEGTAEAHSDSAMVLDELHQCSDPKKAGAIAYQLANEEGKVRANVTGNAKKSKNWKIGYFSTGEKSLPDFLKAQGITIKAGQEVRMPSIPASPNNAPFGCFETIHGAESPGRFAMDLEVASASNRGTAGDAFLSRLVEDVRAEDFTLKLAIRIGEIADELTVGIENSAVKRVATKRFALYLCAIELAIDYGIVPFSKESAGNSIKKVFHEWLNDRGGDGSRDVKEAVSNFLQSIERNLLSSRVYDPRNPDRALTNVLGYWKPLESEDGVLCIPPATFEAEFCKEVKKTTLIRELIGLEVLIPRADGKPTSQQIPELFFYCLFFYRFKMLKIRPGYKIVGKSGSELMVDAVEGDLLICGDRKIGIEAVVRVIAPRADIPSPSAPRPKAFELGDRVEYIGSNFNLKKQYAGTLEIWEMGKGCDSDKCACLKPDGRVTRVSIEIALEPIRESVLKLQADTQSQFEAVRDELKAISDRAVEVPAAIAKTPTNSNKTKPRTGDVPDWVNSDNRRFYVKLVGNMELLDKVSEAIDSASGNNTVLNVKLGFFHATFPKCGMWDITQMCRNGAIVNFQK